MQRQRVSCGMRPSEPSRARSVAGWVTTLVAVSAMLVLLTGCPPNDLKVFLMRTTGFENIVYVSIDTGNDDNLGTASEPLATIQAGIERGQWYLTQTTASAVSVYVAEGAYEQHDDEGVSVVLVEGISLYGGYSTDFAEHDPDIHVTRIVDLSETGVDTAAVRAEDTITRATTIDGFTIVGGSCDPDGLCRAIHCDSASPIISNNVIDAGAAYCALDIYRDSDPLVQNNTILGNTTEDWSWKAALSVTDNSLAEIVGNDINGGQHGICIAVFFWETRCYEFTGNTITGGDGQQAWPIVITDDSNVTISDCVIEAGESTDEPRAGIEVIGASTADISLCTITAPVGVYVAGESYANIHENDITAATSIGAARGVRVKEDSWADVYLNTIAAGPAPDEVRGIYVTEPAAAQPVIIEANTVNVTNAGGECMGVRVVDGSNSTVIISNTITCTNADTGIMIRIEDTGYASIARNMLLGGELTSYSTGIDFYTSDGEIESNVINLGTVSSGAAEGIVLRSQANSPVNVRNNTICAGSADNAIGLTMESCAPNVDSNIFFAGDATSRFGISEGTADADPSNLRNNLFYQYGAAAFIYYHDDDTSSDITDVGTINAFVFASGNIVDDPQFVNADGGDGEITPMDGNDWHLSSSTPSSVSDGGYVVPGYDDAIDIDGVARGTDYWSIGAYEYDG